MEFLNNNFISEFLLIALRWVFSWAGQYWLAIVLVTIAIKFVLLPLDIKQRQSSQKMQLATAETESIKKRYANDPEQANKKVKEYYKENGIKPTAGCLPMLISMVLLFAFYGALRAVVSEQSVSLMLTGAFNGAEAVKLPQWLWVHNVLQPDGYSAIIPAATDFMSFLKTNSTSVSPQMLMLLKNQGLLSFSGETVAMTDAYTSLTTQIISVNGLESFKNGWYGLPIIAGGTLFLQQWLTSKTTPTAAQPGGKMMMYFFPIFSAYICATTNACFAIYWTLSNVFAMAVHLGYTAYVKYKNNKKTVTIGDIR